MPVSDAGRPALSSWIRRAAAGESLCVTDGGRGRCRRTGNVRDDTHAAHAREITTQECGRSTLMLSHIFSNVLAN